MFHIWEFCVIIVEFSNREKLLLIVLNAIFIIKGYLNEMVVKMDKKSIIIILLVVFIVMAACFLTYALTISNQNANQYERVNLSSTCSLELPKIHFDIQNTSFGGSYGGVSTHTDGKTLSSSDLVIVYAKTVDNTGLSSEGVYGGNVQSNVGNVNWYSRHVTNLETGESIMISGTDKEKVDHIANSIIFSTGKAVEKNSTSTNIIVVNGTNNSGPNNQNNNQNNNPNHNGGNSPTPAPAPTPSPAPTPEPTPTPTPSGGNST